MTDDTSTWLIVSLAAMGVAASVAAFLKTPKEQRYRGIPPVPLEEQLKALSASTQAVIIKGDKRRALIKSSPYIIIGILLVGYTLWSKNTSHLECVRILGVNTAYISLLQFCYGLPIGILAVTLSYVGSGFKTIKTGYFPSLDSIVFRDTIAKKGRLSKFRGAVILILPVFALFLVYLGNNTYTIISGGKNIYEITEMLEEKCQ